MQNVSLSHQGINLRTGRKLIHWLQNIGLANIHYGIYGAYQEVSKKTDTTDLEKQTLLADLENIYSDEEIVNFFVENQNSFSNEYRVLFILTFYAYAYVR